MVYQLDILIQASKLVLAQNRVKRSVHTNFGIMFDIDGVIVRGREVLPSAPQAFKKLVDPTTSKFKVGDTSCGLNGIFCIKCRR